MGRVFIWATWWEMGTRSVHWRVSRHTLALPKKGGVLFLKASTNCVLGDHRGHFIIEHSHYYYYYYITIFIKPPPTDE